ncbi:histidine-type phosphatase [Corynebacterium sp. CCM 9185]|uniref:Multiple inositol polyphosphate phosphatase 1 n=1 Tax=Corynebacterium marambiense TaxID=2765364 RepID=A0ABS0VVA6_9CORY|nr:histidine-type phosphatase [Corynebacterium marambiense]MBI9000721.1 histidine-type phosphatase [Corynebacterium marambiense]MCK7663016.1 histidine-type phosphatase [Corynebacterium marambiense]
MLTTSLSRPTTALLVAAAVVLGATSAVSPAAADEMTVPQYGFKNQYIPMGTPDEATTPPAGFEQVYTMVLGRHGSRGASSSSRFKNTMKYLKSAKEQPGALTPLGERVLVEIDQALQITRNLPENSHLTPPEKGGYGTLTTLGAQEWQAIGQRNYARNRDFYTRIAAAGENDKLRYHSSPRGRSQFSGVNFAIGLHNSDNALDPLMGYDTAAPVPINTGVFGADGEQTPQSKLMVEYKNTQSPAYPEYKASQNLPDEKQAGEASHSDPAVISAAREILGHLYSPQYLATLDDEAAISQAHQFYSVNGYARLLTKEAGAPTGGWATEEYMTPQTAREMRYLYEVHDFYTFGPGREGSSDSYRIYDPLIRLMLKDVDDRANGASEVAGNFYFTHGETLGPVESYLQIPQANHPTPPGKYFDKDNAWNSSVTVPMAANIQWDAFRNKAGITLVRMLFNEKETPFGPKCQPIADGSPFYTLKELQACVPLDSVSDHSNARPAAIWAPGLSTEPVNVCEGEPLDPRAGIIGLPDDATIEVVAAADTGTAGEKKQEINVKVPGEKTRELTVPVSVIKCSTETATTTVTSTSIVTETADPKTVTETPDPVTSVTNEIPEPVTTTVTTTPEPVTVTAEPTPTTVIVTKDPTPTTVTKTQTPATVTETPAPVSTTVTETSTVVTTTTIYPEPTTVTAVPAPATGTVTVTETVGPSTVTVTPELTVTTVTEQPRPADSLPAIAGVIALVGSVLAIITALNLPTILSGLTGGVTNLFLPQFNSGVLESLLAVIRSWQNL